MRIITVYFLSFTLLLSCSSKDPNFVQDAEVLLSIDTPTLLKDLAGRNARKNNFVNPFKEAVIDYKEDSTADFIGLFIEYHKQLVPNGQLNDLFNSLDVAGMNNNMSNQEVIASLKEERGAALDKSKVILESRLNRIEKLSNYSVNKLTNSLIVKLKGAVDINQIKQTLTKKGLLEFWETFKSDEVGFMIYESANKVLCDSLYPGYRDSAKIIGYQDSIHNYKVSNNEISYSDSGIETLEAALTALVNEEHINNIDQSKLQPLSYLLAPAIDYENSTWWNNSSVLGYAKLSDTALINDYLNYKYVQDEIFFDDIFFIWEAKSEEGFKSIDGEDLFKLHLIRKPLNRIANLTSYDINLAEYSFDINGVPIVNVSFNTEGADLWSDMTQESARNQTGIAITMDNEVFSVPQASERIKGGITQISGYFTKQEAENLANILNTGALPVPLIIQNIKITPQIPAK